jgi:hypothetical protein
LGEEDIVGGDEQSLARALLPGEVEDRPALARPGAAHGHIGDVERQAVGELPHARAQLHGVARLREDQGFLQLFVRVGRCCTDADHFRRRRTGGKDRHDAERRRVAQAMESHMSLPLFSGSMVQDLTDAKRCC